MVTADAWEEAAERPVEEAGGREGLPFIIYPSVPFGIFLLFLLCFTMYKTSCTTRKKVRALSEEQGRSKQGCSSEAEHTVYL